MAIRLWEADADDQPVDPRRAPRSTGSGAEGEVLNYYRHHIGDYLRDTAHLSLIEDAIYRRLLDLYYMRETPLVDDIPALCRLIRATADHAETVGVILKEFFVLVDGCWRQKRADHEISEANLAADRARENGRKSKGRPRKPDGVNQITNPVISVNPEKTNTVPVANPEEYYPSPIPHPPTNTPKGVCRFAPPTPEEVREYAAQVGIPLDPNRFVDFYASKGWKVGKTPMKDWQAAVRTWGRNADKPSESVRVWK